MTSVLLLVDAQRNMLLPPEPVPAAEQVGAAIRGVLDRARASGAGVVHIRNSGAEGDPDQPGTPGWELVYEVRDGERIVDKPQQDAFAETDLADLVPADAHLVVAGMQSEYCVRETSLSALRRGHSVTLVQGAHATYPDGESAAEISRRVEEELAAEGVEVVSLDDVRFI